MFLFFFFLFWEMPLPILKDILSQILNILSEFIFKKLIFIVPINYSAFIC